MITLEHIEIGLSQIALWLELPEFEAAAAPPSSPGRTADLYHDLKELRLRADKLAEALKKFERQANDYLINNLSKSDDTGAAGLRYRAQIKTKLRAKVAEGGWPQVHGYIQQTGRFDLLQKRLLESAVMDMVEAGETPPGIETFEDKWVSVTKIK